ncbi:MAG: ABC transporter permease subunit [Dialister sp.]
MSVLLISLHTRTKLIGVLKSDFILFAKANRKSMKEIIKSHALRNIMPPAITDTIYVF